MIVVKILKLRYRERRKIYFFFTTDEDKIESKFDCLTDVQTKIHIQNSDKEF